MIGGQHLDDWHVIPIGNVGKVITGNTPPKADEHNYGSDIPWVSPIDIGTGKYVTNTRNSLSPAGAKLARIVPAGSILVTCIASIGKNAIASRALCTNQQINTVVVDERYCNEYVYYCIEHHGVPLLQKYAGRTAVPIVSKGLFEQLELPFPKSKEEQQKIAAILAAVDAKLDVIARQIEATQTLKQGLMQNLFSRGVATQNANCGWVPHAEFKDSELGTIPAAWCVSSIGSLFEIVERAVKMADDKSYRRVTVKRRYGGIELRDELRGSDIKVKSQYALEAGDFLISERQIVHGACGIVPGWLAGALVSNEYLVLKARTTVDIRYFNYLVQQLKYAKYFMLCSQGVDIEKFLFKPKDWLKKLVPVPPVSEQARIADVLTTADEKLNAMKAKQGKLQQVKRGLMQKLLTGEWRVSLDANATGT